MQVSVESSEGLERRMTVELPVEQVNEAVEKRLKEVARTVKMDGFRPGKVPMSVVRKRYSEQVRQEVFGDLVQSTYFQALAQENLQPAGEPVVEPLDKNDDEGMGYTATFEVMSEIALQDISDKSISRPVAEVTDEDFEQMIDKLRNQRVTWNDVERAAQDGDQVTIDFVGKIDGEAFEGGTADGVPLVLGSSSMIDGFESGLVGATADEERTLELQFPEDYRVDTLAGKAATFEVKVTKVAEPVLPELDDVFAKAFGIAEGGVEALHKEVRSNMERELEDKIRSSLKDQAMEVLLEANPIDVPAVLIKQEAEALMQQTRANMAQQGHNAQMDLPAALFEDQAKRRVILGLVIGEVIKANNIELDSDRVRERVEQFAQSYEKPQEVIDYYYSNKQQLASIENVVLEDQVVEWVLEQAKVEDTPTAFAELMAPRANEVSE
ncbi:trigger factor [Solemya velesiana gill symbiont]|uniref:Trigger factor n=1 Tax=Solemya velesiana gill symbiont TaxID=1918948 RepID=A0A1T2KTK0_9GAMM|nr:trigger factor [Solemya velesiana gill symbiont]OOZ36164.1 trigger factor [Solemya velesiana gill symbiont]